MVRQNTGLGLRALLCAALLAVGGAGAADAGTAEADATGDRTLLDSYNGVVFDFNRAVFDRLGAAGAWLQAQPWMPAIGAGAGSLANVASTFINEPVTILSSLMIGDLARARRGGERFAINTTLGVLGYFDPAAEAGLPPAHLDIGLALCSLGVPEGPFVMLPFVGPRTLRDGVSDVVLVNALLYTVVATTVAPSSGLAVIVTAEGIEIVADIVATRQIDERAGAMAPATLEDLQTLYLDSRRVRCRELRADGAPDQAEPGVPGMPPAGPSPPARHPPDAP